MPSPSKTSRCLMAAVCLLTPLLCVAQEFGRERHHRLISFQVPESQATYPLSINEARTITGYYLDKSGATHGFVRDDDGHFTTFDVPGSLSTTPTSINTAGDITGYYEVPTVIGFGFNIPLGFVRNPDGNITTFGGSGVINYNDGNLWPQPVAINVPGEIVGNFSSLALGSEVFVRSPTGTVQTFTFSLGALYSTVATALNAGGGLVGYYSSQSLAFAYGFYWDGQGPIPDPFAGVADFTSFTVTGSTGTFPTGINAGATIVGCYSTAGVYYDFVRSSAGVITTLNVPGTVPSCLESGTNPGIYPVIPPAVTINDQGTVTGYYTNAAKVSVGFVRFDDGTLITFDHPGSKQTIPTSINRRDVITGYYSKGTAILGFIREPGRDR